jgi:hypothetical protein
MVETLIIIAVLAIVVAGVFLVVWMADAKRAEDQQNDPERLDVDTPENP